MYRSPFGKVIGNHAPLAATFQQVEDGTKYVVKVNRPGVWSSFLHWPVSEESLEIARG